MRHMETPEFIRVESYTTQSGDLFKPTEPSTEAAS